MAITVNISSQIVVKTAAQWAADTTVYSAKRILITSDVLVAGTDQRRFKIPNGVDTWANLDYYPAGSGTGTVTSVSVTTNQGVSGSVATSTTTPDITLSLGALTGVTSINGLVITANTGVITTGTWNGSTIAIARGGTNSTTALNNNRVMISSGGAIVEHSAQTATYISYYDANGLPTGTSDFTRTSLSGITLAKQQTLSTLNSGSLMMAYNGRNTGSPVTQYGIGLAYSNDSGKTWFRSGRNPVIVATSGFAASYVAHPYLVKVGSILYCYYTGDNGGVETIGLSTSYDNGLTWTQYGQVIALGAGGQPDDVDCLAPKVLYEPDEPDVNKRWKMWYTAFDGTDYTVMYAYSKYGFLWTKYGVVLSKGAAAQWDETSVSPTGIYKVGTTYNLFYAGESSGVYAGGVATFTNPESTYTKFAGNPVIQRRSTATATLTANTLTGSKTVTVADTSLFQENEAVFLDDSNSTDELNRIFSIDSGTQLTLWNAVTADYTTAQSAFIRSVYQNVIVPMSVTLYDGALKIWGTAFNAIAGRELMVAFNATTPTTGWGFDYGSGVLLPIMNSAAGASTVWDYTNAENPSVIPNPQSEQGQAALLSAANTFAAANTFSAATTFANVAINGVVTTDVRINADLAINSAPAAWSPGANGGAIQIGTDFGIIDYGTGVIEQLTNIVYDGAYKYRNTRGGSSLGFATIASEFPARFWGFAPSGAAGSGATYTSKMVLLPSGNLMIGNTAASMTKGTSAVGCIYIQNSTAPSTSPADEMAIYAADQAAGNSCLHTRTENGAIIKLFRGAAVADATGAGDVVAQLNALLARLRVTGGNGLIAD